MCCIINPHPNSKVKMLEYLLIDEEAEAQGGQLAPEVTDDRVRAPTSFPELLS